MQTAVGKFEFLAQKCPSECIAEGLNSKNSGVAPQPWFGATQIIFGTNFVFVPNPRR
jgi:hypothetical protein